METFVVAAIGAGMLTAATYAAVSVAAAAPTGPSAVDDTVRTLEAAGYTCAIHTGFR